MTRLRSLIKEVLTVQPKKKDCNCGCGGCDKKSPIITEGRIKKAISEGLTYHVENKIPLHESVYRIGSEKHFALINEARKLWTRGLIDVSEDDQAILETHLGNFGLYEGVEVPLDLPIVNEGFKDYLGYSEPKMPSQEEVDEFFSITQNEMHYLNSKPVMGQEGDRVRSEIEPWDEYDLSNWNALVRKAKAQGKINEEKEYYVTYNKGRGQGKGLVKSKESNYEEPRVFSKEEAEEYAKGAESRSRQMTAYWVSDKDMNRLNEVHNLLRQTNLSSEEYQKAKKLKGFNADDYTFSSDNNLYVKKSSLEERINTILEAKKKKKKEKKDPPLNKPKRGGSKAYYVYVRDPKTKKIKKVSFGSGGLRAKIKNKEARNAFAARHNCKNKKDRTKAGYWSCNLPRYAEQLGLGSKMNTFW